MKDHTAKILCDVMETTVVWPGMIVDQQTFLREVSEGICGQMLGNEGYPVELRDYFLTNIESWLTNEAD